MSKCLITDNDETIYCLKMPSNTCLAATYSQSEVKKSHNTVQKKEENQPNKSLYKREGLQILPVSTMLKKKSLVVHLSASALSSLWIPHQGLSLAFIRWISNLACRQANTMEQTNHNPTLLDAYQNST